jgi:hypothetical protein
MKVFNKICENYFRLQFLKLKSWRKFSFWIKKIGAWVGINKIYIFWCLKLFEQKLHPNILDQHFLNTGTGLVNGTKKVDWDMVPHSQCSSMENPKVLQNFRPTYNILRDNFLFVFLFNIYYFNSVLAFQNKHYYTTPQNFVYFVR